MTCRPRHSRQQLGFTIVEILIAIVIGLLLTLLVAHLFTGSRSTFHSTDELSRLQENMRYAHQLLSRVVHLTGYKSAPNSLTNSVFAAPNVAITGTQGAGTAPDTLTVRFQGNGSPAADGTVLDCDGTAVAAGAIATNVFNISAGGANGTGLFCNGVEVVTDVDNMQLLYGEDTNNDLVADRFVSINNVANVDNIVAVRVALLFSSAQLGVSLVTDTATYDLNGVAVGPFNDNRIRRVMTTTFNLRNRTP
ncbi:MAG: PilW family protein [Burkholderiales bacterium]